MPSHKFKVGQVVDFSPGRLGMPVWSREYKIIRLLPAEGGDNQYRIKSATETFERIAKESQLSRRSDH